jgi:hypothetical protein
MDFKNAQELLQKWEELCESQHSAKNQNKTTIGAEIEFFLMDSNHHPVTLQQSQIFMHALKTRFNATKKDVKTEFEDLEGQLCLSKVKFPSTSRSWTYVCYEYPPHLLEVSFAFHENLLDLHYEVRSVIDTIHSTASECRLIANFSPKLTEEEKRRMHTVDNALQKKLHASRVKMVKEGPYSSELDLANFPSYLAATHVHIGGHKWWNDEKFIDNLYRLEPYFMHEATGIDFKERWDHYHKVFHHFALVGFPKTSTWTMDWWIRELFDTSYQMQKETISSSLGLNKLRDLQIIRPRAIGTIEFRSDAAQQGAGEIMHLAALRLGQYLLALEELPCWLPGYELARKLWNNQMQLGHDLDVTNKDMLLELIHRALQKRGMGEEKLLQFSPKKIGKTA